MQNTIFERRFDAARPRGPQGIDGGRWRRALSPIVARALPLLLAIGASTSATVVSRDARAGERSKARVTAPAQGTAEPRCHPDQDLVCTVVRETPAGVVVTTIRKGSVTPTWWVVSGAPGSLPAGTIFVVPAAEVSAVASVPPPSNDAPIIE